MHLFLLSITMLIDAVIKYVYLSFYSNGNKKHQDTVLITIYKCLQRNSWQFLSF